MPQLVPDINQTLRLLTGTYKSGSYSGVTTDAGFFTFPHGAPFTPTIAFVSTNLQGGGNQAVPVIVSADATNLTVFFCAIAGSAVDLPVAGSYRVEA